MQEEPIKMYASM